MRTEATKLANEISLAVNRAESLTSMAHKIEEDHADDMRAETLLYSALEILGAAQDSLDALTRMLEVDGEPAVTLSDGNRQIAKPQPTKEKTMTARKAARR